MSNGMSVTHKTSTRSIHTNAEVPSFIEALLSPEYQFRSVEEFKTRINRVYDTTASLKEVLHVDNRVRSILGGNLDAEILMENMSANYLKKVFSENYLKNTDIHKYLRTNITVWELVNEVTAISSRIEQNRIAVDDRINRALQIIGGQLLFQGSDLQPNSIKQIF